MKKLLWVLFICVLCIGFFGCASSASVSDETGNYVRNGDFAKIGSEWPNLPFNWNVSYQGGDDENGSPIKTENGRLIGWARHAYSFKLSQNIKGIPAGTYTLCAELRLNSDSEVGDIVMNVYSGSKLIKSKSVRDELSAATRETDVLFELTDIEITGSSAKIEFVGTNIVNYIGIDNVIFFR